MASVQRQPQWKPQVALLPIRELIRNPHSNPNSRFKQNSSEAAKADSLKSIQEGEQLN